MNHLNTQRTALTVAFFVGGWHFIWSLLVAFGVGQIIFDFILWAHMIHFLVTIGPFDVWASGVLITVTFIVGYVFGFVFAYLWNRLYQRKI